MVLVAGTPTLPKTLSMVEDTIRMVDHSLPGFLEPPETLARKLYNSAYLETDPKMPHGIQLALQSQAFYRMMIDQYFLFRVKPILEGVPSPKILRPSSRAFKVPATLDLSLYSSFDVASAYAVYDDLTTNFWRKHIQMFTELYLQRAWIGKEGAYDGYHSIGTEFRDLPQEKKRVFASLNTAAVEERFNRHAEHVVRNIFRPLFTRELLQTGDQNPDLERRIRSAGASTSFRSIED